MGGGDSEFAYKMIIFALVIMLVIPLMINNFVPEVEENSELEDEVWEDYYSFTGGGRTKEAVWVLTGIYTPYNGGSYGYTDDGWLYGSRVSTNTPTQYQDGPQEFTVYRDNNGIYRYKYDTSDYDADAGTGHRGSFEYDEENNKDVKRKTAGDMYTSVVFDSDQKSNIFFTPNGKKDSQGNPYMDSTVNDKRFYYEYTGYRYAFQPTSDSWTSGGDGQKIKVTATTTSLSLIWYSYYTQSGISGQLILSGSDSGVGYINGDQIVKAFDSTTNTARFDMTFNGGVQMGIYVKMDAWALQTRTVKEAYDQGFWSVMVTSQTTDSEGYTGTDFSLNIYDLFGTLIKLMTFKYSDFNMSPMMGVICSFVIIIPLYAGLITLAMNNWPALVLTGILAVVQTIASLISNMGSWWDDASDWWPFMIPPEHVHQMMMEMLAYLLAVIPV